MHKLCKSYHGPSERDAGILLTWYFAGSLSVCRNSVMNEYSPAFAIFLQQLSDNYSPEETS